MGSDTGKDPMLPLSDPPKGDERLFKGSAMTKRGAHAAISYMTCAGTPLFLSSWMKFLMCFI